MNGYSKDPEDSAALCPRAEFGNIRGKRNRYAK
jgi:hypothetical protein